MRSLGRLWLRIDGANAVQGVDLDQDGDLDMLRAAFYATEIAWWENAGG